MNYATHNIEFAGVSDTGMPICPVCGKPLLFVGHYKGSGDRFLILVCLVNIQYSRKGSNSSREQVGNPVSLLRMIHKPFP